MKDKIENKINKKNKINSNKKMMIKLDKKNKWKKHIYILVKGRKKKKERRNTTIKLIYRDIIKNDIETMFLNI